MNRIPFGDHQLNWNETEKISMAPAQGRHAQIEKCKQKGDGTWGMAQCVQSEVRVSSDESNDSKLRRRNWVVHRDE